MERRRNLVIKHMGVFHRGLDVRMVQRPLDQFQVPRPPQKLGRHVMPDVMEAEVFHLRPLHKPPPLGLCAFRSDRIPNASPLSLSRALADIWAKYGIRHAESDYQKLVRVSHWTEDDVAREKLLALEVSTVEPDFIADRSFAQVMDVLAVEQTHGLQ